MSLIGLDIGTTGCKACLFTKEGKLLGSACREYTVDFPHPNWAEQDGENVWRLAQEAIKELLIKTGEHNVEAIGLSVHGEAVTAIDEKGRTLRPFILGMDTRTVEENRLLNAQFGASTLYLWTGMPIHTINTLPKLLWIKRNEPEIWKNAAHFLLVEDFFIYKMTGQFAISRCLSSRTQCFNLQNDEWSQPILSFLGLDDTSFSHVLPSGSPVATMYPSLSTELGFDHPPLLVTGGHDQACGALGVGLTKPGLAMVSTGTAEVVEVVLSTPVLNQTLCDGNISIYAHVVPGLFLAMTLNHSGGLLLRWFRDNFCESELQMAANSFEDAYDLILNKAKAGPTGLLVLPHFSGSGTPWFDTTSKGAILGLTFAHTKYDIAKSILEGLTYELRINLDLLKSGGVRIDALRAIGGGARSDLWLKLKADISGIPVVVPEITEAASLGAAILAGVGAGIFPNASQAIESMLNFKSEKQPDFTSGTVYNRYFELYRQVYPAIRSISHQL